ncbi:MAG: hypothetical protein ABIS27_01410 [Longimicrobiales bacterium]
MKRDNRQTRAARRAEARASGSPAAQAAARPRAEGKRRRHNADMSPRGAVAIWIHKHPWLILATIVSVQMLFALLSFMPQPHTGGDSANYMTLGRSLLQNHTYTDLYDPALPPHTKYPPVFPLILAAGMAIGLTTWVQLKLVMLAIGAGALALTFLWIRRRGRPVLAAGVCLMLAFSAGVIDQSHWLLSDVPFWFLTMLALFAFERARPHNRARFAIAVIATVLAYFTRSAGLPLVVAVVLWLAWRRRWQQLALFGIVLAPLALLWWLRAQNTGGVEYTQEFWLIDPYMPQLGRIGIANLMQRMGENAVKYVSVHIPILLTGRTGAGITLMSCLLTAAAVYGWITRLSRARVAELFTPLYIGLILIWPAVWSGERFIMPLFPVLLYYAGIAMTRLMRRVTPTYVMAASAAIVIFVLLLDVPALNAAVARGRACTREYSRGEIYPCLNPAERSYFDAALWSEKNLTKDAVILSRKPRLFYEISHGIRGTTYPMAPDTRTFFTRTDSVKARYVIFDRLTSLADVYLAPVLLQRPQAFCTMGQFGSDGTTMFGILPGASAMPDQPVPDGTQPSFAGCDRTFVR